MPVPSPTVRRCLGSGDLDGTQSFGEVTDADISFTCGCTGTPAPAPDAPPIAADTLPPASAPTVGADASGSVAARLLDSSAAAAATALVTAAAFALAMVG